MTMDHDKHLVSLSFKILLLCIYLLYFIFLLFLHYNLLYDINVDRETFKTIPKRKRNNNF